MSNYIFFCTNCSYKKIIQSFKDIENFYSLNLSQIQNKIPKASDNASSSINQTKKFKCPKCGFANAIRSLKGESNNE